MKIAFFGTPDFAVPSLRALLGEGFEVAAVITQPDKPQGRSRSTLISPPVKDVAIEEGIPVLQPGKPLGRFVQELRDVAPDIGVVIAYGHILKPELLAIPRLGMINVHASLLPLLRGAAPIQHALIEGLEETGVSIMQMDEGMDTGPVMLRVATPIFPDETAGELTERLSELGALALVEALQLIAVGSTEFEVQAHAEATRAPKITRDSARISWEAPAEKIARLARSLDPKPGAWTELDGKELKLFGPRVTPAGGEGTAPGTVLTLEPTLTIQAGDGAVEFLDVQPSGGTRMPVGSWARGHAGVFGQRCA